MDRQKDAPRCLMCGETLVNGRLPRKFCDRKCRNDYHNKEVRQVRLSRLRVTNRLEKNYAVLRHLTELGIEELSMPQMSQLGFAPDYFTSCYIDGDTRLCCCYDIQFRATPSRIYDIKQVKTEFEE
ncbi:MAG: hypothetical protein MJY67_03705 [Bacteroidales bacterium]|nr:hypothetical protein [Bacteroidales bacterium]